MARSKEPFSQNKELQARIIEARLNNKTVAEIALEYPQYSKITYGRFLAKNKIRAPIPYYKNADYLSRQSDIQKKSWEDKDPEKKDKHIEHLRSLSDSQKGIGLIRNEEWKENNLRWVRSDTFRAISIQNNRNRKKYTEEAIRSHAKKLGVEILSGDLSDSENTIKIMWPNGATRSPQIKVFMKIEHFHENRKRINSLKKLNDLGITVVSFEKHTQKAVLEYNGIKWEQFWNGCPNSTTGRMITLIDTNSIKTDEELVSAANAKYFTSAGEEEIVDFLSKNNISARKRRLSGVEYDIVSDEHKVAIEYNGLYWHSEAKGRGKEYHLEKTKIAESHGYRLLHVFEHEWRDRRDQTESYLLSVFGKNKKVFARKCELVSGSCDKNVSEFLEKYHIQGSVNYNLYVGLTFDSVLVAVATFGRHHRDSKKTVLNRFVCRAGITVTGGLSRISKHASSILKTDIVSWCDIKISQGNGYLKSGWIQDSVLRPDYFYFKNAKIISKQSRRKSAVNTPEGMTEREHAIQDGLTRVWDCGKIRFVYRYKGDGTRLGN